MAPSIPRQLSADHPGAAREAIVVTQTEAPISKQDSVPVAIHMQGQIQSIPIDRITIGLARRPLHDLTVLMESITTVGLLQPIVVLPTDDGYRLVSGLHRLAACRSLGWTEIPALVATFDVLDALLAEIDENLARVDLSQLELAEEITRWKQAYEAKYPDSVRPKGGRRPKNAAPRSPFSDYAATKRHVSPRYIEQTVQIAASLTDDVKTGLRDTPWADQRTVLRQLCRLGPEQQREVTAKLVSGQARSVRQALHGRKEESESGSGSAAVDRHESLCKPPEDSDESARLEAAARDRERVIRAAVEEYEHGSQLGYVELAQFVIWLLNPSMTQPQAADRFRIYVHNVANLTAFAKCLPDSLRGIVSFVPPREFAISLQQVMDNRFGEDGPALKELVVDRVWDVTRGDPAFLEDLFTLANVRLADEQRPDPPAEIFRILNQLTPEQIRARARKRRAKAGSDGPQAMNHVSPA